MAQQTNKGMNRRRFLANTAAGVGGAAVAGPLLPGLGYADASTTGASAYAAQAAKISASDQQYQDLVLALNPRWVATPDYVHVVDDPDQIAPIVANAVRGGKRLTVRSGGHCFLDFVYNSEVDQIIDLTNMNRIYYDQNVNAIAVESGAILLDVYEKLYQTWGVVAPGGVCYSVGIGGHVAGGGWGWLVRRDGLIVDHLYAVEVVVVGATGAVRTIIATREADDPHRALWWAHTGGGGGNFGVVTRYFFRSPGATGSDPRKLLPKPPARVLFNLLVWDWNQMSKGDVQRLLKNYGDWHVANKSPDDPSRFLTSIMQVFHKSAGQIVLLTEVDAGAPNAQSIMDEHIAFIQAGVTAPIVAAQSEMPWLQFVKYSGTTNKLLNDPTLFAEYKSAFWKSSFTQPQLDSIYKHLTRTDISNPNNLLVITPYGGKTAAVPQTATAIPHREASFKMLWSVMWANPADEAQNVAWTREFYAETFAGTGGVPVVGDVTDGCYVNYPDADLSDPVHNQSDQSWHDLYYKDGYRRLQRVKKTYDPRDFFRHRQSVELPS
jgi:hypothetical protein